MKKQLFYILLTIGFVIVISKTNAQKVYININSGYGFSAGSQSLNNYKKQGESYTSDFKIKINHIKYSLGKGINTNATIGFILNKNINIELGFGYLIGSKIEYHDINNALPGVTVTKNFKSNMPYFIPSLVLKSGFKKINPYAKVGIFIGIPKVTSEYIEDNLSIMQEKLEINTEYKMDWGLGANTCIGVIYEISKKIGFLGECKILNLAVTPKSSEYTKYSIDGKDRLLTMNTNEKKQIYLNELTLDSSTLNSSEPAKLMKYKMPFSSIGANIGIKIKF